MQESTINRAPRESGLVIHTIVSDEAHLREVMLKQEIVRELGFLSIDDLQQVHDLVNELGMREPAVD